MSDEIEIKREVPVEYLEFYRRYHPLNAIMSVLAMSAYKNVLSRDVLEKILTGDDVIEAARARDMFNGLSDFEKKKTERILKDKSITIATPLAGAFADFWASEQHPVSFSTSTRSWIGQERRSSSKRKMSF